MTYLFIYFFKAIQSSGMLSLEIKQFEDTVDGLKEEIKQLESTVESLNVDISSHEIRFVEVTKEKNVVEQVSVEFLRI